MEIYTNGLRRLSPPPAVMVLRSGCHASASMHFRPVWRWPSPSVTQWRSFTVPFLSSFLLVQFYLV